MKERNNTTFEEQEQKNNPRPGQPSQITHPTTTTTTKTTTTTLIARLIYTHRDERKKLNQSNSKSKQIQELIMPPKTDADAGAIEVPLPDHELGIANAKEDDEAAPSDEESPPAANAKANEGNPVAIAVAEKKEEEEDEKLFSFLTGMKNDLIARKPYYNFKLDCNGGGNGDNNKKKKKKNADNDNDVPRIDVVGIVSSTTSNGNESSSYEPIRGDWSIPKNFFTVFNATIFAFVIQLIPALIFAELMDRQT